VIRTSWSDHVLENIRKDLGITFYKIHGPVLRIPVGQTRIEGSIETTGKVGTDLRQCRLMTVEDLATNIQSNNLIFFSVHDGWIMNGGGWCVGCLDGWVADLLVVWIE